MALQVVKRRADLVGVLEAIYANEPDMDQWFAGVMRAFEASLVTPLGVSTLLIGHKRDYAQPTVIGGGVTTATSRVLESAIGAVNAMSATVLREMFYPGVPVTTHHVLARTITPESVALFRFLRTSLFGCPDLVGAFAYPQPGMAMVFSAGIAQPGLPPAADRNVFMRIVGHLDSALRLRMQPEHAIAAVLAPDGSLRHLADPTLAKARREWFGARVATIDAGRVRAKRVDIDPWWALFDGRYSIVPIEDRDGKRHYLLVTNQPSHERHARFSSREADIVRLCARGLTNKAIAYNLGISPAHVSDEIRTAALKVGLRSRHDLVRVAAGLFGVSAKSVHLADLSVAEREILDLLRRGLSNEEIARRRGRSPNTIKNQIASMLRKTGSASRRGLAVT